MGEIPVPRLQAALAQAYGTATTVDQAVTVQVGANGTLRSIELSERGSELPARELVAVITQLHELALTRAGTALSAAVARLQEADEPEEAPDQPADTPPDPEPVAAYH